VSQYRLRRPAVESLDAVKSWGKETMGSVRAIEARVEGAASVLQPVPVVPLLLRVQWWAVRRIQGVVRSRDGPDHQVFPRLPVLHKYFLFVLKMIFLWRR